jgi:hypothetical protein
MTYALVQTEVTPPTLAQFKQAFRALKRFAELDAVKAARHNYGVLIKGQTQEDAATLRQGFQAHGVVTELVPDAELAGLAAPKFTRRAEFQPQALLIYDVVGRAVPVEWRHIELIAAGNIPRLNVVSYEVEETELVLGGEFGLTQQTVTTKNTRLDTDAVLTLEIIVAGGRMRFQIEGESFLFKHAFDRPDLDARQKFAELARQLMQRAPQALTNRGAAQLRNGEPVPMLYGSKQTFADESAWLLWRTKRPAPAQP